MRDFSFWHDALNNAKTPLVLKSVGAEIAAFQNQGDFLGTEVKLTTGQVASLRKFYAARAKKLAAEVLDNGASDLPKHRK